MGKALAGGTIIAGAALTAAISKTAELGDEAAKTGRRLGISAEALQELRFAADRQGVSAGVLNSSFTALQKRVGELKSGTGSLYGFLKKTGDKAFLRQISLAKNTEEAFALVTEKVETIEDPLKKAAFAAAAFSRSGVAMLSFMEAGQDGIKKLREEAQKYGAVISNEAAEQSEVFVDALTNLKSSLTGIGKTFSTKLIPSLSDAMQRFADFWAMNKKIINAGMDRFLSFIGDTFAAIKPGVIALFKALKQLFSAFWEAVNSLLPEFNSETDDLSDSINSLTGALKIMAEIGAQVFKFIAMISPVLKPLIATFLVYKGLLITIAILTKAWAVIQGVLNAVMAVNPIGLILIAIAALIVGIILLVQNWDMVVAAFKNGIAQIWGFFSGLLDNPFIAAAGIIFAPFIALPALIIKHWEPISEFFVGLWTGIKDIFSAGVDFVVEIWSQLGAAFSSGIDFVMSLVKPFMQTISSVGSLFEKIGITFGSEKKTDDDEKGSPASGSGQAASPQVVTQAESMRRIVEESRETTSAEVLIRDETGRAELRSGRPAPGIKIAMANSGGR